MLQKEKVSEEMTWCGCYQGTDSYLVSVLVVFVSYCYRYCNFARTFLVYSSSSSDTLCTSIFSKTICRTKDISLVVLSLSLEFVYTFSSGLFTFTFCYSGVFLWLYNLRKCRT